MEKVCKECPGNDREEILPLANLEAWGEDRGSGQPRTLHRAKAGRQDSKLLSSGGEPTSGPPSPPGCSEGKAALQEERGRQCQSEAESARSSRYSECQAGPVWPLLRGFLRNQIQLSVLYKTKHRQWTPPEIPKWEDWLRWSQSWPGLDESLFLWVDGISPVMINDGSSLHLLHLLQLLAHKFQGTFHTEDLFFLLCPFEKQEKPSI